jgi:hypothetical protein
VHQGNDATTGSSEARTVLDLHEGSKVETLLLQALQAETLYRENHIHYAARTIVLLPVAKAYVSALSQVLLRQ